MRIINVITVLNNVVDDIESFPIYEERLSDDVITKAEQVFTEKVKNIAPEKDMEDIDVFIEEGFYENSKLKKSINLSWSYTE